MARVSVIIPSYNCAAYLPRAVESVLAQTFQDFELIIVDDGSTDGTEEALAPYRERIVYRFQANQGESVARNVGIGLAGGEYIAFLDADDWWEPAKLERQVRAMDDQPAAVMSYTPTFVVDHNGDLIEFRGSTMVGQGDAGCFDAFPRLVIANYVASIDTVMVRRACFQDDIPFDPAIQWGEDWDLWLRLALQGPFLFIPEPLASYRMRKPGRRLRIEASDEFVAQNEAILRRVFSMVPPERGDRAALQPQAFAALCTRSALYNFELGDTQRGTRYIERAAQMDRNFLQDGLAFARRIADEGFRIGTEAGDWHKGIDYVKLVFGHLPPVARDLSHYASFACSELHVASAFTVFAQGDRPATRRHVIEAIKYYLPAARNLGLLSVGVQAVLGGKPWAGWRRSSAGLR